MGGAKRQSGEKWAGKGMGRREKEWGGGRRNGEAGEGMGMREKEREVFDMGSRGTEDLQRVKSWPCSNSPVRLGGLANGLSLDRGAHRRHPLLDVHLGRARLRHVGDDGELLDARREDLGWGRVRVG